MIKKSVLFLFSLCLLFLFSVTAAAAPEGAQTQTISGPVYLEFSNPGYVDFKATSFEFVDMYYRVPVDSNGTSLVYPYQSCIARLSTDLDFISFVNFLDNMADGRFTFDFTGLSVTLSNLSGLDFDNFSLKLSDCRFTLPNGVQLGGLQSGAQRFAVSFAAQPFSVLCDRFSGVIHLDLSVTIRNLNNPYGYLSDLDVDKIVQNFFFRLNYSGEGSFSGDYVTYSYGAYGAQQNENLVNGYDSSSGDNANSDLQSGLTVYESDEAAAQQDFSQKMDAYEFPDTTPYVSGVSFVASCITMWFNGLGIFQIVLFVAFALMIFNFISRYRGGG